MITRETIRISLGVFACVATGIGVKTFEVDAVNASTIAFALGWITAFAVDAFVSKQGDTKP